MKIKKIQIARTTEHVYLIPIPRKCLRAQSTYPRIIFGDHKIIPQHDERTKKEEEAVRI